MKTVSKILKSASEFIEASSAPVLSTIVGSFFILIFTAAVSCSTCGVAAGLGVAMMGFATFSSGILIGRYEGRRESAKKKQEAMEGR